MKFPLVLVSIRKYPYKVIISLTTPEIFLFFFFYVLPLENVINLSLRAFRLTQIFRCFIVTEPDWMLLLSSLMWWVWERFNYFRDFSNLKHSLSHNFIALKRISCENVILLNHSISFESYIFMIPIKC